MKSPQRVALALAGALLLAPLAAAAQSESQPEDTPPATEAEAPKPDSDSAKEDTAEENKRVCKSVRADPSSRRKTRVCRTMEEWREMNIPT